jgi:hypothetical protein
MGFLNFLPPALVKSCSGAAKQCGRRNRPSDSLFLAEYKVRVEVYAIGTSDQLRDFALRLRRGPAHAAVTDVAEVDAEILQIFSSGFSVTFDR